MKLWIDNSVSFRFSLYLFTFQFTFSLIPFHFISSHFTVLHLTSPHLTSLHFISFHLIHLTSFYFTSLHFFLSISLHFISLHILQEGKEPRSIYQFHYTGWPDHGVPDDPSSVLNILEDVNIKQDHIEGAGPIVVHCR